ncbi:hypothetical protein [Methanonatronarchaeum sp. AMET6-2]|uniref:hypothetical protein n=1 Tax=Methanonatronarchaeum sp. AMET6-2 TaxID=2933293 RepID=UPI00120D748D|nr:hypothetical protein [Methanonatronarchaeum sp. AMET6-2]RZN60845.1 MAG: hypothetical protein EF811_06010 [Methanonatronarchaeia archaeon]UOY09543.1 hypothetical protein MU439_04635 [Methanonatronarchaeum sp. AMET6-2]
MTSESMWHSYLEDVLLRSYKVEAVGEYLYYNRGLLDMDSRGDDTLDFHGFSDEVLKLIEDSKNHKSLLDEVFSDIELPLIEFINRRSDDVFKMYFRDMEQYNEFIFVNLIKNEYMMVDLYRDISTAVGPSDIELIWGSGDPDRFFEVLKTLIDAENKHQELIGDLLEYNDFRELVGCIKPTDVDMVLDKIDVAEDNLYSSLRDGVRDIVVFETDNPDIIDGVKDEVQVRFNTEIRHTREVDGEKVVVVDIKRPFL